MQSRIHAVEQAQKNDDPSAAAKASQRLVALTLAQVAEVKLSLGEAGEAAKLYEQSIELEDNPGAHYHRAIALMTGGQNDEALREVAIAVERDPKNPAPLSLQGKLYLKQQEYQRAADALTRSLSINGDWGTAYDAATAFLKMHEPAKAAAVFEQLEKAGMNPVRLHTVAGRAYETAEMYEDAAREYKRALAFDPKSSHAHYALGLMYLTRNSWEPTPEARKEIEAEVAENPTDYYGNFMLGYLLAQEKNYDASDRHLKIAAKAQPSVPEAFLYLGLNAFGRGDYQSAKTFLKRAIALTGTDEGRNYYQIRRAYFALGRSLVLTGHKDDAAKYSAKAKEMEAKLLASNRQKVLDANTESPDRIQSSTAKFQLSDQQKSELAEAEKRLRDILGNAYNNWGIAEARLQDYPHALDHFRSAEPWNAETPGLMRNLGMAAFLSGNDAEAVRALKIAVEQEPSDQQSQSVLAMSLFALNDFEGAAQRFARVEDMARTDLRMSYEWAYSLAQIHNSQGAIQLLEQMVAHELPPEMLVQVGSLYSSLGKPDRAAQCFEKARAADPEVKLPR